ncbi:unnamed protein product, partial [Ectocarpus sp. 4 AP-2014]
MSVTRFYDGGRDSFLARSTSNPPSKFDSIEHLERDVHNKSFVAFESSTAVRASGGEDKHREISPPVITRGGNTAGSTHDSKNVSTASSVATTTGAWSWGDGNNSHANTEVTQAASSSWKAEVSGKRVFTAPPPPSSQSPSSSHSKKFFWGPKVARKREEAERNIRRTNHGDPATFALAVDECPSTVSTIRSLVPRRFHSTEAFSDGDSSTLTGGPRSAYVGLEPFIRTSITDRIHDGIYETDIGHKSTLGGRVKRGEIRCPKMSRYGKRFADDAVGPERQQLMGPGYYDTSPGIDSTSKSSMILPLPREKCNYDSYIRRGVGQTTGSAIGPGQYEARPVTSTGSGRLEFSTIVRWTKEPSSGASPNQGPWDDVEDAWGRGGYIERAVPRECKSYLPQEILRYKTRLEVDHFGKESFATAIRRHPKRYAASFSNTQEPDWRVNGNPNLGPGTYAVELAESLTLPAPQGGAGDVDPARPSIPFCVRRTPFDTRRLADGYKTLKPRFSTPRTALYMSELPRGTAGVASDPPEPPATTMGERKAGGTIRPGTVCRKRLSPAAK